MYSQIYIQDMPKELQNKQKNLLPKYSNLALKYEVIIPIIITNNTVPIIKYSVFNVCK